MTEASQTLTERLDTGTVLVAEGYIFELERRGFLKAGPFVPEVVLKYPEAVKALHDEFVRCGTDVVVACTYYAHRSKLQSIGIENALEQLNVKAVELAVEAARESGALVAGNICNTWEYDPSDLQGSEERVRQIFREQVQWAKAGGADFIIAETFSHYGEALLSLEEIKAAGLPAVITFSPVAPSTCDGFSMGEACKRLEDNGADVVGLDLDFGSLRDASKRLRREGDEAGRIAEMVQGNTFHLPFRDETFDKVICSEVMEHVHDYKAAARELARVTRPGGRLAITIPTATSEHLYLRLGDEYFESPGGHIRIFRPRDLARGLAAAGLSTTGVGFAHGWHTPYWVLRSIVGLPDADESRLVQLYRLFLIRATGSPLARSYALTTSWSPRCSWAWRQSSPAARHRNPPTSRSSRRVKPARAYASARPLARAVTTYCLLISSRNEFLVNITADDQMVCDRVQHRQVTLRSQLQMLSRRHGSFRTPRVDHDDFRRIRILEYSLPHDRMADAWIRTDEYETVALLKIVVGVRRCVEPE